ncbi:GNAT family N-acetyltransferase [Vibrio sp. Y2-5]|uniref:GNAT family N-acetyltransferase n=1 Tax=Vibrio sp. Y2-5 TaxID=2743977 RepID=UPI001660DC92|nr:GNAT family N-acetyltransferase [Vibrio sp. Y2-5]MBD0786711.1 GNAT family N-acetyltransferase [Vibrio sp. Y2-5]
MKIISTLLKKLALSRRNKQLKGSSLVPAKLEDVSFIFNLVVSSAEDGHFNPILTFPPAQQGLLYQIATSIKDGWCYVNPHEARGSQILIKRVDGQAVGFSWITSGKREYELYLLAVEHSFRKQGIGTELLLESIKVIPIGCTIYGRLYRVSKIMAEMMKKIGFRQVPSSAQDTVRFEKIKVN